MSGALQAAALVVTVLGLASGLVTLVGLRDVRLALGVLLDFLVGAGLLRLADDVSARGLVAVTLIIAIRKLVMRALNADQRLPTAARR